MNSRMSDVDYALQIVREELSSLIAETREEGAAAYAAGDAEGFQTVDARRAKLEEVADDLEHLWQRWQTVFDEDVEEQKKRESTERVSSDSILTERAYVFPILRALLDAGGAAKVADIMESLEAEVGDRLTQADWEEISTGAIRWQNRAQWVRRYMVLSGLLSDDSPRGVWEITDAGRQALKANDIDRTWERLMEAKRKSSSQ